MKKKTIICTVLALALALGLLSGCGGSAAEKEFSQAGVTITLNENFVEDERNNVDITYSSEKDSVVVMMTKYPGAADMSLNEFAENLLLILSESGPVIEEDGLTYFTYVRDPLTYFNVVYIAPDAGWVVQFAIPTRLFDNTTEQLKTWAKSVKV